MGCTPSKSTVKPEPYKSIQISRQSHRAPAREISMVYNNVYAGTAALNRSIPSVVPTGRSTTFFEDKAFGDTKMMQSSVSLFYQINPPMGVPVGCSL